MVDDADVAEEQPAVVRAHLGGVDADALQRVERLVEQRAAGHREGQPEAVHRLLPGQRGVQAVDADGEADRRQRAPEAPEQVVVAPAAAQRLAERGVVDVEHRAGVVAQPAGQAEVEDARARATASSSRSRTPRSPASASATGPGGASSTSGPPRSCGTRTSRSASPAARSSSRTSRSSPTKSLRRELLQQPLAVLLVDARGRSAARDRARRRRGRRGSPPGRRRPARGTARSAPRPCPRRPGRRRARCRPAGTRASGRGAA